MKKYLLAATFLVAPTLAYAADLPARVAAPAPYVTATPVFTWTGLYVGINGGYGTGTADYEHKNVNNFGGPGGTYSNDVDGGLLGGQAGYNFQVGTFVFGVEGSADWSGVKGNYDFSQYHNNTTTNIRDLYMVSGRAGFAFDRFMVYGKGGWAGSDVKMGQIYYGNGPFNYYNSGFQSGWQAGVGVEYALANHFGIGLEYTYVDLGSKTHTGNDSTGRTTSIAGKVKEDTFLAKINYHF